MHTREQPTLFSADLTGCAALSALSPDAIRAAFIGALERAGATIVQRVSHDFPNAGMTCTLILAESHATLHTWPETSTVNVDIFCCSSRLNSHAAIRELAREFAAADVTIQTVLRADGHRV